MRFINQLLTGGPHIVGRRGNSQEDPQYIKLVHPFDPHRYTHATSLDFWDIKPIEATSAIKSHSYMLWVLWVILPT